MEFTLADREHEPQLRALLGDSAMPGWVQLRFERDPDFFHAAATQGAATQVLAALDGESVVGMACRSTREVYVNGVVRTLGYLSGLRLRPSHRGATLLARGYGFLKSLHADGSAPAYLTTIIEGNLPVRRLLTSGRAGLPRYLDMGRFFTFALPLGSKRASAGGDPIFEIRRAAASDLSGVVRFLAEHGSRRQFFPVVREADFGTARWRQFDPRDLYLALGPGESIAGVAGCWDQSTYKQTRVNGYSPLVTFLRRPLNPALRLMGWPELPDPGSLLRILNLCLVCVRDDNPLVLDALLTHIAGEHAVRGGGVLCVGLHESDPLCQALQRRRALRYVSRLYWVCWDDGQKAFAELEPARVPYLEVATL